MRHLQGISAATCLAILSLASPAVAGDTLRAGERLYPDQAIGSGGTVLLYQADNNLVLYQNGSPIWATMAGLGYPTDRFEMQTDCNAVVYGHTHVPQVEQFQHLWVLNPGSPTDRRRQPVHTMLVLQIRGSRITPELVTL